MPSDNISIKEIAKLTGLSVATVSRVINRKGYYSAAAEEKVRRVAEEYHYVPNLIARSLKTNRTDTIGIIIPDINGDFFSKAVLRMQLSFFAQGYSTIIFNTNHDLNLAAACMNMMRSNQVSGIINFTGSVIAEAYAAHTPVLYFDRKAENRQTNAPFVVSDNLHGGCLAARQLAKSGCQRPTVLVPARLSSNHRDRLNGFMQEWAKPDMPQGDVLCLHADGYTIVHGAQAVKPILRKGASDGIFAVSDYLTTGALQAASEFGIDVTKTLHIVGYDVDTLLRLLPPIVTSIDQPLEQMTDAAVETLLRMMRDDSPAPASVTLDVALHAGQTA